jgi:hypothetical protein
MSPPVTVDRCMATPILVLPHYDDEIAGRRVARTAPGTVDHGEAAP